MKTAEEIFDELDYAGQGHYTFLKDEFEKCLELYAQQVASEAVENNPDTIREKFLNDLEVERLKEAELDLRSLKQSILEGPLKPFFPEREMSFHDKVILAIGELAHSRIVGHEQALEQLETLRAEKEELVEARKDYSQFLREEFLINTQTYPEEYHKLFWEKFNRAEQRFLEKHKK